VDWSLGNYEHLGVGLRPAAVAVVERAAPSQDAHVVDVGCGTGNAALLAAECGATVTGVDPAFRLLHIARADARARGLELRFVDGAAEALPLPDGVADVVISVFGVIFASDPFAAAAEMVRVATPAGTIVLSAWVPGGALSALRGLRLEVLADAGRPAGPAGFAWHEEDALAEVFGRDGFSVTRHEHTIGFTAASPRAFIDAELRDHPQWVACREVLEGRGRLESVREQALNILEAANEDPSGFRVTSRYVIAMARRMERHGKPSR
jgi:SAM-dependent methyltransferase